jgi:hypothetical protein
VEGEITKNQPRIKDNQLFDEESES